MEGIIGFGRSMLLTVIMLLSDMQLSDMHCTQNTNKNALILSIIVVGSVLLQAA